MTPDVSPKERNSSPHLALLVVQIMFGTWPIFGKIALRSISSTGLVGIRVSGAAVAFLLLQRRLNELRQIPLRDLGGLVMCSLLGVAVNQYLYVKGVSLTSVIDVALISTTIPIFTLVISIVLGHDRLSFKRIFGILLAASGVVYLINPVHADFSLQTVAGNLLVVTSSLAYGGYIVLSKNLFKRYGALNVITWVFLIAAIVSLPIGLWDLYHANWRSVSPLVWLNVVYIVLVPTVGAYYLNALALTRVTPSTVAIYIYLQPLIAFGLAPVLLGERWSFRTLVASVLIFAGVGVVTIRGRSQAVKEVVEDPEALSH